MPSTYNEKHDKHLEKAFAFISKLNKSRKLERPYKWTDLWGVHKVLRWTFAKMTLSNEEFSKKFKAELDKQMQAEFDALDKEQRELVELASKDQQEAEEAIEALERHDKAATARSNAEKSAREAHMLEVEHKLKKQDAEAAALAAKEAASRADAIARKKEIKQVLESKQTYLPQAGQRIKEFKAEIYQDHA
jgi:hypothetical protein